MRNKAKAKPKIRNDTVKKVRKRVAKYVGNKKVRNARETIIDGIKFRSSLEAFTYKLLIESGLEFQYEPQSFELIPPFEYKGEKIRAATYKPDFVGPNWIIEVKGFETDAFKLRWKMFKWRLSQSDTQYNLFLPKNQAQVREAIERIVNKDF
jgi:hypothetical protein